MPKEKKKKHFMLTTLTEAYTLFKIDNPEMHIGFSNFCEHRQQEVKLIQDVSHSSCLCVYHENVRQIIKDSFDFINKANQNKTMGMKIGVADNKSLYTNITHKLGLKAMQFWITKLQKKIPLLQRLCKHFIMEALF